jgi:DNA modification methylase
MAVSQVPLRNAPTLDFGLEVVSRDIDALNAFDRRARTHSKKQVRQIARSIEEFGFLNPVLVDGRNRIIAGHGRVAAAGLLGMVKVPTIRIDHMSEAQIRFYVIADNKLAENAGWDWEILAIELQFLSSLDINFDLTLSGFDMGEIDILLGDGEASDESPMPPPFIDRTRPAVSRVGDLWRLGPHRLLCGDATDLLALGRLMADAQAQMVFIDPPYNVRIDGHASGLGKTRHQDFAMASGEMSEAGFMAFLERALRGLASHSRDGAICYVCMDWRHLFEAITAGRAVFTELKNIGVWVKSNAGMGSLYRSQHELVLVFKNGTVPHINNIELGRHGRHRTNVWQYPGLSAFGEGRDETLSLHPTVKPVALVADAMRDCSHRGGIVLDSFAGSGTTLIAAEVTGRKAYALELDPYYVDVALERFEDRFGVEARHAATGLSFSAMRPERTDPTSESAALEVSHG